MNRREITDSRVLAAMSHPLRRRLLDVLDLDGPATATQLAQRTDQAVANVSHHLKVMAAAELVQEAPELARDRRERWWRTAADFFWSSDTFGDDPASEAVSAAAQSLNLQRQFDLVRRWYGAPDHEHALWPTGPFSTNSWLKLTDAELAALGEELNELLDRYRTAGAAEDGVQRSPVFVFANAAPGRP